MITVDVWRRLSEPAVCLHLLTGPWSSLESTCTHCLTQSSITHIQMTHKVHTHMDARTRTHRISITTTAPTCLMPLTTCLSHCCHKPHGRLRGHPMRRMVRMKMLVMRKRCYVSAELPQQRCSGAWALVQGCKWMWGRWRRWFHRCGPVWRGPEPAA